MRIVVRNGDGGEIGEQRQEDNQVDADGLVDDDHGRDEVDLEVQAERDTVLDVGFHALEDLAGDLDRGDDGAEAGSEEDDVRCGLGGFGRALDGDTAVGFLERGRVVDAVACHGRQVAALLEHLDDLVLMFWEDLREAIRFFDEIVLRGAAEAAVDELVAVVDFGAEGEQLAGLLGDGYRVAGEHLYAEAEHLCFGDRSGCVFARGVEHREHAEELPWFVTFFDGYAQ